MLILPSDSKQTQSSALGPLGFRGTSSFVRSSGILGIHVSTDSLLGVLRHKINANVEIHDRPELSLLSPFCFQI